MGFILLAVAGMALVAIGVVLAAVQQDFPVKENDSYRD